MPQTTIRPGDLVHVTWPVESANCRSLRSAVTEAVEVKEPGWVKLAGDHTPDWGNVEWDDVRVRPMTEQDTRDYLASHGHDYDDLGAEGRALAERLYQEAKARQ